MEPIVSFDASKALNQTTLSIHVKVKKIWLLKLRVWLGAKLIGLAGSVFGCGEIVLTMPKVDEEG